MATNPELAERWARDEQVMAGLRAGAGVDPSGRVLIILHLTGAQTGQLIHKPVCVREDGDDLVVAASAGGQRRHPQWYGNLVAHSEITVEFRGQSFPVVATTVANSLERDRLFHMMSEEIIGLYGYQDRCRDSRQIPIIRLARR